MKLAFILLLLFLLTPSPHFINLQKEVLAFEVETLQQKTKNDTSKAKVSGSEVSKDISQRENGAFSIPAGNAGDNPPQAIGIPASKTNNINGLYYILLSLPLSALAGWLVFRKRYSPTSTTGPTTIHGFYQELRQEDSGEDLKEVASTDTTEGNEEVRKISRIKEFMVAEQPYLDPELTIKTLADQLDMEVRELSVLINTFFQQNFYDFLNQYRIEKAKKLLRDSNNKKLTILEILYSVGFNSKSSFNTSFKKLSGLTPTQYRQKYCK